MKNISNLRNISDLRDVSSWLDYKVYCFRTGKIEGNYRTLKHFLETYYIK